jgi:hypothetical protein
LCLFCPFSTQPAIGHTPCPIPHSHHNHPLCSSGLLVLPQTLRLWPQGLCLRCPALTVGRAFSPCARLLAGWPLLTSEHCSETAFLLLY